MNPYQISTSELLKNNEFSKESIPFLVNLHDTKWSLLDYAGDLLWTEEELKSHLKNSLVGVYNESRYLTGLGYVAKHAPQN